MRINYLLLVFSIGLISCNNRLLNPLIGGRVYTNKLGNKKYNLQYQAPVGTTIYLEPQKSLIVRAIEDCQIIGITTGNDSVKIIVAKGRIDAGYGNLQKSYVVKGEHVLKGQPIGTLFAKDSVNDNFLAISLQKQGKPLLPKW